MVHYHKRLGRAGDSPELTAVVRSDSIEINIFSSREQFCKEDVFKMHTLTVSEVHELVTALDELMEIARTGALNRLDRVRIRGVMGMATYTENEGVIREEFRDLKRIFEYLKVTAFPGIDSFDQRSFGMSGDYRVAVEEGSTMVRIGSLIFGPREY